MIIFGAVSLSFVNMLDIVLDMETQDPDDYLTLLLLLGHKKVRLKAVTITPGSSYQVGLVRRTLDLFEHDIPVGAYNLQHPKTCVSPWHEKIYGAITPSEQARDGSEVLVACCDENTILLTGAPLKNVGKALDSPDFHVGCLVAQGGFAGEGVIPLEHQLEKFKGKLTCPTFNLNGDVPSAFKVLATDKIAIRYFVSKNVCHGVHYDTAMHASVGKLRQHSLSMQMIYKGMDAYLKGNAEGKKMHDPLAACCAIDRSIGEWAEVELFRQKGEWGSRLAENTRTWIIKSYHHEKFIDTFTQIKEEL